MSDTETDSIAETGPATARDVTLAVFQAGAQSVIEAGKRPTYQQRIRGEVLTRPPLMYDGMGISKLAGFEEHGTAVAPAVDALHAMHAALASVIDARNKSSKDPTLGSEAAGVLKVADYADRVMTTASQKADAAYKSLQSQIKSTQAELNQAVAVGTQSTLATEIRAHCKAHKSPTQFVAELIAAGDTQGVNAILGGPSYLSGLTPQMREALTTNWNRTQNPALTSRLALLQGASDRLERAGAAFIVNVEKAMGVNYGVVKRLRDAKSAASFG